MPTPSLNPARRLLALAAFSFALAASAPACAQSHEDGSAQHPFLIQSRQELEDLRDCLASGSMFYFVKSSGTYSPTMPAGTAGTDFLPIPQGGRNSHFRLSCDISLNLGNVAESIGRKNTLWTQPSPVLITPRQIHKQKHIIP